MNIKDFLLGYEEGKAQGGGSSADVRYVTFMSHDGAVELGKKAVAVGDDCADPIARGVFETPTKESTAQYNYSFVGWATTPNGAWDEAATAAVTEDRTVYAAYAAALRYYTIMFYDDDGTTVLKTQSLAYGAMPSYTPTKENHLFVEWSPKLTTVTGNAIYTAVWEEKVSFSTASWAKIGEICAAGNAANVFAVGDYRPITLTYKDGTTETINFRIVDMYKDPDISKNPLPLTLMADSLVKNYLQPASQYNGGNGVFYKMNNAAAMMNTLFEALPSDLQAVIKDRRYSYYFAEATKVFIPSKMGILGSYGGAESATGQFITSRYRYFANGNSIKCTKLADSAADDYWLESLKERTDSSYTTAYYEVVDGTSALSSKENAASKSHGIRMCFCI